MALFRGCDENLTRKILKRRRLSFFFLIDKYDKMESIKRKGDVDLRLYFNRCFTQTAEVIRHLKTNSDGKKFEVYVSSYAPNYYLESVSDYFEVEPAKYTIAEYIDYCYQFCQKHQIEVFIPRHHVSEIAKHRVRFEAMGVKLLLIGEASLYQLLDNKVETYRRLETTNIVNLPPYGVATTYPEFWKLVDEIQSQHFEVCIKPVNGIGGVGFKRLKQGLSPYEELMSSSKTIVSFEKACQVLKEKQTFEPLMVLGYLEGEEFSIDCLGNHGVLIDAVPRVKLDAYTQQVEIREELIEVAKQMTAELGLHNLYNIQVKYHKGQLYLIEVNTRMSGGTFKSCLAGINLPYKAICQLMGESISSEMHQLKSCKIQEIQTCEIRLV